MVQLTLSEISLDSLHILVIIGVVSKKLDDVVDVLGIILQVCLDVLLAKGALGKTFHVVVELFCSVNHLVLVHLLLLLIAYIKNPEHLQLIVDKTVENVRYHGYQAAVDLQPLDDLLLLCVRDNTPQREGSLLL